MLTLKTNSKVECVDNFNADQRDWFEPRYNEHVEFVQEVDAWIQPLLYYAEKKLTRGLILERS